MSNERPRPPRPRRPTPAERREQRSQVDDPAVVLEAAARYLEARQRSVTEVRRHLQHMGYRTELVGAATTRLEELGLLDDDAFAKAWVESRDRARPRGEHALRRELGQRGVSANRIDAVLDERREAATGSVSPGDVPGDRAGPGADESAAERLLAKKLPAVLREPDPRRRLQRAYALLARNGFSPDVCSTVARRLLAGVAEVDGGTADDGGEVD